MNDDADWASVRWERWAHRGGDISPVQEQVRLRVTKTTDEIVRDRYVWTLDRVGDPTIPGDSVCVTSGEQTHLSHALRFAELALDDYIDNHGHTAAWNRSRKRGGT